VCHDYLAALHLALSRALARKFCANKPQID